MSPREANRAAVGRDDQRPAKRASQILWFLALWLAGLATVGTIAFIIRSVLL